MSTPREPAAAAPLPGAADDGGRSAGSHPPHIDPVAVLRDLPPQLWAQVVEAFRAALPRLARSELPPTVRPYAGWRADALGGDRPRAAIAAALAGDARLRGAVQELLDAQGDAPSPAAALVAAARWPELLALSTAASDELAGRHRAAAEVARRRRAGSDDAARRRLSARLATARAERDEARERLDAALRRAEAMAAERDRHAADAAALRDRVAELEGQLETRSREAARRLARQRRRTEEAEARARIDADQTRSVAIRLSELSTELQAALGQPAPPAPPQAGPGQRSTALPRDIPPAAPGRPCGLPAGLTAARAEGAIALLRAPGMLVLIDGYNVSKHPRGVPVAGLADQRGWLLRVAEGVAARHGCRVVLVFDGSEPIAVPAPASRAVRTVFTTGEEIADDRIVAIIQERDPSSPVLAVTSDRELAGRCAALAADVVAAGTFLQAVRA